MLKTIAGYEGNIPMTNYVHPLSVKEQQELEQFHDQTKVANERSRSTMILLSHKGLSPPQIAQHVRVNGRTVRRYIARYENEGLAGLQDRLRPGRQARVTVSYLEQLERAVEQMPRDLDLPFSNWTTTNLAEYMTEKTGIRIKARQMENYLKKHQWRLRRPVGGVKHKQDPQQVAEKKS